MKKVFTLIAALMGFAGVASAETVDDIAPMLHSYVCVFDAYTANGTGSRTKGALFGAKHFLDVNGGSVNNGGKGSVDLATMTYGNGASPLEYLEGNITAEEIEGLKTKYGKYGLHINSLRLKNAQDVIACKPTAGSVIYVFGQGNNKSGKDCRIPKFSKTADLAEGLNDAPAEDWGTMNIYVYKFVVPNDFDGKTPLYIGSYNGDSFFSYIIVEANEPAGTPAVELGEQSYDEVTERYYIDITCTPAQYNIGGVDLGATEVHYTLDGSEPTLESEECDFDQPIRCYQNQTVKFQAFFDIDWDGKADALEGANNEATAEFSFNAPAVDVDGATATITSDYQNATNWYTFGDAEAVAGDSFTATASGFISAYTVIDNKEGITFITGKTTAPIYLMDPIKEKTTITVSGNPVVDEEATAKDPNGNTVYAVENGKVLVNGVEESKTIFVQTKTFKVVTEEAYQINGEEVYLQMSGDMFTFKVAEGDSINVTVTTTKNSCKNLESDTKNYVNVNGTNYGNDDVTAEGGNIITFGLTEGTYTFKKYSGTGNILVSSIVFEPATTEGIANISADMLNNGAIYNVAGQRVNANMKGLYIQNGKKFIVK